MNKKILRQPDSLIQNKSRYVASIQAGRGVAAVFVLLYHIAEKVGYAINAGGPIFRAGAIGVDIFFMISGFIIFHVTVESSVNRKDYFLKRFVRVFPLYWILSLFAFVVYIINPHLINSHSGQSTAVLSSFFLFPSGHPFLVNNGWTLTYEIIFYVAWGVFVMPWLSFSRVWLCCSVLLVVSVVGSFAVPYKIINASLFFEFFIGVVVSVIYRRHLLMPNIFIGLVIFIMGLVFAVRMDGVIDSPFRGFLVCVPAGMIFVGVILLDDVWRKLLLFSYLGDSSYSLYLFHPFILALFPVVIKLIKSSDQLVIYSLASVMFIGSLFFSYFIHKFVEDPLILWFRRFV